MKVYKRDEVLTSSMVYFRGDELAANVWINKYALKDSEGNIYELNPDDMHRRIAGEIARIEKNYVNPMSEDEIYELIKDFKYVIPQGGPMSGIGNTMQTVSLSNCFVVGNDADSYGGITQTDQEQIQLMKRRGGVGHDLSHIRPKGSPVKNSALTSTGVVTFMERFSNSTREVAQDGRRGALMLSISIKHPDSIDFIDAKVAPGKITGANVSVKIDDDFMKAVNGTGDYIQQFPITGVPKLTKEINAKDVFNKIVYNAWKSAEPGILFWDTIIRESVPDCYADLGYRTVSTNPCVVGDTIIATADGRNGVNIKQLVEEGKDVPVYSTNIETGKVEIKVARNPRLTGQKKEVWKLTLDDNSTLIATPNHKILLKTLEYVELKDLKPGDSIMPFYSFNSNGYRQVSNTGEKMTGGARRNRRQYRLINEFYNGKIDARDSIIHHKDFNSFNDSIDNLQIMSKSEHVELHSKNMIGKLNPYHRMTQEWKKKFASKPGEKNPNFSGYSNQELIKHGKLLFEKNGLITKRKWAEYAKENNLPQDLVGDFRFNSFSDFKNQVAENHKVKYVEFYGYEDVYNITVDDNHNYHIITSNEDSQYITSSGICIKNCGEIPLCPYDSCRLIAINLYSYVVNPFTDKAEFDYVLFEEHVAYTQRIMDDIIDLEIEKIDAIIEKIESDPEDAIFKRTEVEMWQKIKAKTAQGRRTGIGVTAEGDMIAAMGLTYGTPEATKFAENIHKTLAVNTYKASAKLAKERGSFEVYDFEREKNNPFIKRLFEASPELEDLMKEYGRRNIALLTIAPTGCLELSEKIKTSCGVLSIKEIFEINNIDISKLSNIFNKWFDLEKEIYVYDVYGNKHRITKLYWNGNKEGYTLFFSDNIIKKTSIVHKFLVLIDKNKAIWKEAKDLVKGDKIVKLKNSTIAPDI